VGGKGVNTSSLEGEGAGKRNTKAKGESKKRGALGGIEILKKIRGSGEAAQGLLGRLEQGEAWGGGGLLTEGPWKTIKGSQKIFFYGKTGLVRQKGRLS